MTTEPNKPKEARGGTFAPTDVELMKKMLLAHITDSSITFTSAEEQQIINLYHRLGRIS